MNLDELCTVCGAERKDVKESTKVDYNDKEKKIKFSVQGISEFGLLLKEHLNADKFLVWCKEKG